MTVFFLQHSSGSLCADSKLAESPQVLNQRELATTSSGMKAAESLRKKPDDDYWKALPKKHESDVESVQEQFPSGCKRYRSGLRAVGLQNTEGKLKSASWQCRGNSELACVMELAMWAWSLVNSRTS